MSNTSGSTAVMARRHEPPNALDFFPTPPWATRALCTFLAGRGECLGALTALDPACGEGDMVRPLQEHFRRVRASDIHDYGDRFPKFARVQDFTDVGLLPGPQSASVDWVVTNPPFNAAEAFLARGLDVAVRGVALLLRSVWSEGEQRYKRVFAVTPPTFELQFSTRVAMHRRRLRDPDLRYRDPATGQVKSPTTATAYSWFVWIKAHRGRPTVKDWIVPDAAARRALTRPGDYPDLPPEEQPMAERML